MSNLPPGVSTSMLPSNSRDEEEWERMIERLAESGFSASDILDTMGLGPIKAEPDRTTELSGEMLSALLEVHHEWRSGGEAHGYGWYEVQDLGIDEIRTCKICNCRRDTRSNDQPHYDRCPVPRILEAIRLVTAAQAEEGKP